MQPHVRPRPLLYAVLLALLLLASLGTVSAIGPRSPHVQVVAAPDGEQVAQEGQGFLPVFQFLAPNVTISDSAMLSTRFEGIYRQQPALEESYLGNPRYTIPNTETNSILEQYGATGGFYAYNARDAFSSTVEGPINANDAEYMACQFLFDNELFPSQERIQLPDHQNCDFDPEFFDFADVSLAYATSQDPTGAQAGEGVSQTVAAIVRVPMVVNIEEYGASVSSIPLGGAGGHISLLFRSTDFSTDTTSLDDSVPGLAAVAMPYYGRELDFYGQYPAVDPISATMQVQNWVEQSFPEATEIVIPEPRLMYLVDDAAVPQRVLEPELLFPGIQVTVEGETIIIRDISVPATEGLGPEVAIIEPENGREFMAGEVVTFTGVITAGINPAPPYSYTWMLDNGALMMSGTMETTGTVTFATSDLPVVEHDGVLAPVVVYLSVQDAIGVQRQANVALQPVAPPAQSFLSLPLLLGDGSGLRRARAPAAAPAGGYSFGVEQASDYPPYGAGGADLGGVVGDVTGFRSGMEREGWDRRFHWSNASAWEKDWRDCSLGGGDCSYGVDRTDFVYFAGHGGPGGLSMPSNVDSTWFAGSNARFQQARWVGFASCQTLRAQWSPASAAPIRDWFNAFQGAHLLLGFNSNMADVEFGGRLVDNMRLPRFFLPFIGFIEFPWAQRTIAAAWTQTAFEMNAGMPAYLFAVGTNGVNPELEKLPRAGDPPRPRPWPVASYNWVWWDE